LHIEALYHESRGIYAYPVAADTLFVRLRTLKEDACRCNVYYTERYDYSDRLNIQGMELLGSDELFSYHGAEIRIRSKRFKYFFEITGSDGEKVYYTGMRICREFPPNTLTGGYFQYAYINEDELPDIPEWVRDAVFYQIFPDRFCNGDKSNDPPNTKQWGTVPGSSDFFGGDIRGIISKLDYLESLGINAIYITPIFQSFSNHKYDIVDYYSIDPCFGTLEDMKELVRLAHEKGIRIVLDAVFNHCSVKNRFFEDVAEKGADSRFSSWFFVEEYPVVKYPVANYETFGENIPDMPRLNTCNPEVQEYLIGVAEYWTRELDIDGWRLDVADEVSHSFWRNFRKRLKAIKKDLFIVGEIWYNASDWLMGDEFDSVMNYPLRQALVDYMAFGETDSENFVLSLKKIFFSHRRYAPDYFLNLLGSHDTPRIMTVCGGDARKLLLSMAFMMTFTGIPMIFYGDETGMEGGGDPDCRRAMQWDMQVGQVEILEKVKRLISIRRSIPALSYGKTEFPDANREKVFVFKRVLESQKITVLINAGEERTEIVLDGDTVRYKSVYDLWNEERFMCRDDGSFEIGVGEFGFRILLAE